MSPNVQFAFFGKINIEVNGTSAEFKRRKSEALVAYLALHEGVHYREKIASLFWGDSSDEDARRTLRVVLTDVRKALGEDVVLGDRDTLTFNTDFLPQVDAHQFRALLNNPMAATTTSGLLEALELYRGDLLEEVYEDWVIPLRENYRASAFTALNILAERARSDGQYARAIEFSERMLKIEPLSETALQNLLVSLTAAGEKERALERFKLFESQSGLELTKETRDLLKQIREQAQPAAARLSNLPRPLTSFIGREDELNEVETLLTKHRLVTLLGAGGSGKTRLSIQAADEIVHNYNGGVWWVDLSPLAEADLVPQVIAKSLGVREQAGKTFIQSVSDFIGERKMLILLDNCEQVLQVCAQSVAALLMNCPQLTVLATSRESLGVDGEIGWQVPVFPLPEAGANLKDIQRNEAARLFLERGRSANPNFDLTGTNAVHIVNICRRLDGIPLALELAATLLRSMTVEDVARRLERQFASLHISDDVRPLRQQTLKALINWSYNLLTPAEQIFFRRLGVFAGGWSFESAMIVAGGYGSEVLHSNAAVPDQLLPLPISATDIVYGLLDSLKRRSLISVTLAEGVTRYRMLETLREYARERCIENNELSALQTRHLKEALRLANEMDEIVSTGVADQVETFKRFDFEVDNVRTALGWALDEGDVEAGMLLGAAVYRYWAVRQMFSEIRGWLGRLCSDPRAQTPTRARGYGLTRYALSLRDDQLKRYTTDLTQEARKIFNSIGDIEGLAHANYAEGETLLNYGNIEQSKAPLMQALAYFRANPKNIQTSTATLASLSRIEIAHRNFEKAYAYIEESLAISEKSMAVLATGWSLLVLGDLAFQMDDLPLATQRYQQSLELYFPLNRLANIAYLQEALAAVTFAQGDIPAAHKWVEASIASYDDYGGRGTISLTYRAAVAQAEGDHKTAKYWLLRALEEGYDLVQFSAMYALRLADYALSQGLTSAATTLYALTLRLSHDPSMVLFSPEIRVAQAGLDGLRQSMPAEEHQAAVDRADSITYEAAVCLVLQ